MTDQAPKKRKFKIEGFDTKHEWMTLIIDARNKHQARIVARESGISNIKKLELLEG